MCACGEVRCVCLWGGKVCVPVLQWGGKVCVPVGR